MSQQFVFWRTAERLDAAEVYAEIMEGEQQISGLEVLDIASLEREFIATFPTWNVDATIADGGRQTALSFEQSALDIGYTAQSVTCTCYGMNPDGWNEVIEAMLRWQLPLYDPQTNERFD